MSEELASPQNGCAVYPKLGGKKSPIFPKPPELLQAPKSSGMNQLPGLCTVIFGLATFKFLLGTANGVPLIIQGDP